MMGGAGIGSARVYQNPGFFQKPGFLVLFTKAYGEAAAGTILHTSEPAARRRNP